MVQVTSERELSDAERELMVGMQMAIEPHQHIEHGGDIRQPVFKVLNDAVKHLIRLAHHRQQRKGGLNPHPLAILVFVSPQSVIH